MTCETLWDRPQARSDKLCPQQFVGCSWWDRPPARLIQTPLASASMRCTCASSERLATGHMRCGTSS